MNPKILAVSSAMVFALAGYQAAENVAWSAAVSGGNCPGATLDKTTTMDARKDMEKAGYSQIKDLHKGCDNFWHGMAMKGGSSVHLALSPQGKVMTETN